MMKRLMPASLAMVLVAAFALLCSLTPVRASAEEPPSVKQDAIVDAGGGEGSEEGNNTPQNVLEDGSIEPSDGLDAGDEVPGDEPSSADEAQSQDLLPAEDGARDDDGVHDDGAHDEGDGVANEQEATAAQDEIAAYNVAQTQKARDDRADEQAAAADEQTMEAEKAKELPSVSVLTHVQRKGWDRQWVSGGKVAGTTGSGLRMEAVRLRLEGSNLPDGVIRYRSHVQGEGWQGWVNGDAMSGSVGMGRRVEAIQISLTSTLGAQYDVWYRVHCQGIGWMAWAKNGQTAGTAGRSLRMEAIQVVITARGAAAPAAPWQNTDVPFVGAEEIMLSAHVQRKGWLPAVGNGAVAGTTGEALRLEALVGSLRGTRVPGGVEMSAHVQREGWMPWVGAGHVAGTTGQSLRVEAIKMRLTGEAASAYDLYYRAHVQGVGWLSWAAEGEPAGSSGLSLRAEAVQAVLVPEGSGAPTVGGAALPVSLVAPFSIETSTFVQGGWQDWAQDGRVSGTTGRSTCVRGLKMRLCGQNAQIMGGVTYRVHVRGGAWQGWAANDGSTGTNADVDAIQVRLTGAAAGIYDVWYRAHAQSYGWMGWTRNGQSAGTANMDKRLEAVQVMLVPRAHNAAPGSTVTPYRDGSYRSGLDEPSGSRAINSFGGYAASSGVTNALNSAIAGLRGQGYDVGFIMMDLNSLKGVAYNCDALFYAASSIKGPYIASVAYQHPDSVAKYSYDMTQTLFYSWDYNYRQVLAAYGSGPMKVLCQESGANPVIAGSLPWAHYTARDQAKLWARTYQLYHVSAAVEQVGKWSERPNVSTIHTTLGGRYRTRSKAGWIDAGGAVHAHINGGGQYWRVSDDGGIVYAPNGDYVVAIMSSVPANHNVLNNLTRAIDAAHQEM